MAVKHGLKRSPVDYFKMLHADTAVNGEVHALRCGHAFFTTKHSLFATDAPFDAEKGRGLIRDTIAAIEALGLPKSEKQAVFDGNARALLKIDAKRT